MCHATPRECLIGPSRFGWRAFLLVSKQTLIQAGLRLVNKQPANPPTELNSRLSLTAALIEASLENQVLASLSVINNRPHTAQVIRHRPEDYIQRARTREPLLSQHLIGGRTMQVTRCQRATAVEDTFS